MLYTVLLLYPDYASDAFGQETYLARVDAKNPKSAVVAAQANAGDANKDVRREDFHPLLVVAGHHDDLKPNS